MESIGMGDDEDDQPTNSSDQEVDHDHVGTVGRAGRSYECMFCKRGFTTAQALGGHMNIHRKDRAKNRPTNYLSKSSSNKQDDSYDHHTGPTSFFQPLFASYPPTYLSAPPPANHHHHHHHHQEGRQLHYFSSTSGDQWPINYENNHQDHRWEPHDHDQVITNTSREEERRRISLQFGWSNGEDKVLNRRDKEDELDLELRLGHDP